MSEDDLRLIKQVLSGKKAATKKLYELHEPHWFRLCLRYGRNRSEAQDIFQEGVAKIFAVIKKFDAEKGAFRSWSNKVLVNEALKYLKKQQWHQSFEELSLAENYNDSAETGLEKITAKELIEIVRQLPLGYRLVFNMYEIEGYSHKEIAEALNISVGTSKSQLSKAKKALQQKLAVLF